MIFDIHVHVAGLAEENGNYGSPQIRNGLLSRLLSKRFRIRGKSLSDSERDASMKEMLLGWLGQSRIDRAVLLAMDGFYSEAGQFDENRTCLKVDNDYVADIVKGHPKALFGASIHPYRSDSLDQLDRLVKKGACLVKWLPSAQNIRLDHPRCIPFYKRLAHHGIPLLCHTGVEHTLTGGDNRLNNPQLLVPALEQGVTVIAAHCGTRIFLHEKSYFKTWCHLALNYPNFFGDIGAFVNPLRIFYLKALLKDSRILAKVVYASDFPTIVLTTSCLFQLGIKETIRLSRVENPIDKPYLIMRALGFPDSVFSRAQNLLRIPSNKSLLEARVVS